MGIFDPFLDDFIVTEEICEHDDFGELDTPAPYIAPFTPVQYTPGDYLMHKMKMVNLVYDLACAAGDEKDLDTKNISTFYHIALLKNLVDRSKCRPSEKSTLLDAAMRKSQIFTDFSGQDIYNSFKTRGEMYQLLEDLPYQFSHIVSVLVTKTNRLNDLVVFLESTLWFLFGVEQEMAKQYPGRGFGNISPTYCKSVSDRLFDNLT